MRTYISIFALIFLAASYWPSVSFAEDGDVPIIEPDYNAVPIPDMSYEEHMPLPSAPMSGIPDVTDPGITGLNGASPEATGSGSRSDLLAPAGEETAGSPPPVAETKTASEAPKSTEPTATVPMHKTERRYNPRIPRFQQIRPEWAFSLNGSGNAFSSTSTLPKVGNKLVRAISLQFDYLPPFVQSAGVLGIGPALSVYPIVPFAGITNSFAGMWSIGGQFEYQARYFHEQPIVPFAGYSIEYWNYAFVGGASGHMMVQGPRFGGMIYLNFLDPDGAKAFFVSEGVIRTYLLAEVRMLSGTDPNVNITGKSLFFGLRFEF